MSYDIIEDDLLQNQMVLLSHHIISNAHLCECWQQKHSFKSCKNNNEYTPSYKRICKNKLQNKPY